MGVAGPPDGTGLGLLASASHAHFSQQASTKLESELNADLNRVEQACCASMLLLDSCDAQLF